ncbi:MAG: hypothetical protein ABI361_08575 [Nitrososphaera sp.]
MNSAGSILSIDDFVVHLNSLGIDCSALTSSLKDSEELRQALYGLLFHRLSPDEYSKLNAIAG